jgi:hypothetical protein
LSTEYFLPANRQKSFSYLPWLIPNHNYASLQENQFTEKSVIFILFLNGLPKYKNQNGQILQ